MRFRLPRCLLAAILSMSFMPAFAIEGEDFMRSLVAEMADPEGLATISSEASYSLSASVDPKGRGANFDQYVSKAADGTAVLAELQGPGCVRRIFFSGAVKDGTRDEPRDALGKPRRLLFYFDGEKEPRFSTTVQTLAADLLQNEAGTAAALKGCDALVGAQGGGYYCYLPFPYEKSLRITMDASALKGFSYQIGSHHYAAKPAALVSWRREALVAALINSDLLARVSNPEVTPITGFRMRKSPKEDPEPQPLAPGVSSEKEITGAGIIRELTVTWVRENAALQRGLVLRAYWDDEPTPSLEVPVDDLFGFDHGQRADVSTYVMERKDGDSGLRRGRLWLPMPFARKARLVLTNENRPEDGPIPCCLQVQYKPLRELDPKFAFLHARWTLSEKGAEPNKPHVVLESAAAGRLIGCVLAVNQEQINRDYLELPELLSIDGKDWNGSFMEHFFNGSRYYRRSFTAAFHAVPIQHRGNVTQFRFFIPDSIPFEKSFSLRFPRPEAALTSLALWYQREPHAGAPALPEVASRSKFASRFKIPGALEAETDLKVITTSAPHYLFVPPVVMTDDQNAWSNEGIIFCRKNKHHSDNLPDDTPGKTFGSDWFVVEIPVQKEGDYEIIIHAAEGPEYSTFVAGSLFHTTATELLMANPEQKNWSSVPEISKDIRYLTITAPDGSSVQSYDAKKETFRPVRLSLGVQHLKPGHGLLGFALQTGQLFVQMDKLPRPFAMGLDAVELLPQQATGK